MSKAIAKEILSAARQGISEYARTPHAKPRPLAAKITMTKDTLTIRVNELVYKLTITLETPDAR